MTRNRVLIQLSSDFHVRSFFSGDLIKYLNEKFELCLVINKNLRIPAQLDGIFLIRTSSDSKSDRLFRNFLNASLVKNRSKSSSFRLRIKRSVLGDYSRLNRANITGFLSIIKAFCLSAPGIYKLTCNRYKNYVNKNSELYSIVKNFKPEIIVSWAQSIEPAVLDAILVARTDNLKSLLVYDNWDNLSSKGVIFEKPDYLVCFGERSVQFATRIHGIESSRVYPLGSARFDVYQSFTEKDFSLRTEVLIAGSSISLEDAEILKIISAKICSSEANSKFMRASFIYRPHPLPQGPRLDLYKWHYPGIQIDEFSQTMGESVSPWQDQVSLAKNLSRKQVVVSGPTTLLLEALLSGCYLLIPALKSKGIRTSSRRMLLEFEHLKNLDDLDNCAIVYDAESLISGIECRLDIDRPGTSFSNLGSHVTVSPGTFATRFVELLQSLTK